MTDEERHKLQGRLAEQTKAMRAAQKLYFRSRRATELQIAKAAEAEVDAILDQLFPPRGPLI